MAYLIRKKKKSNKHNTSALNKCQSNQILNINQYYSLILLTKYVKVSHWVLCSPTSILRSCAKASLCQYPAAKQNSSNRLTHSDKWVSFYFFFFFIWALKKKKKKKPVANNILRYLITLNFSFREEEEFWLYTEKFTKGQSLLKLHFKTVIKETIKFPCYTPLWDIKKLNLGNARYIYRN